MSDQSEDPDAIYYICDEAGILDGPYCEKEANRILDEIQWDKIANSNYPDDGNHPYDKVIDRVQSKCNELRIFRMADTNLRCQIRHFLDSRNGLEVGYLVAYVDFYQSVQYCSPDDVESVSGVETQKRFPVSITNFGCPKLVKWE